MLRCHKEFRVMDQTVLVMATIVAQMKIVNVESKSI